MMRQIFSRLENFNTFPSSSPDGTFALRSVSSEIRNVLISSKNIKNYLTAFVILVDLCFFLNGNVKNISFY